MRTEEQQEQKTPAQKVFDLGKEHHGLVYQRRDNVSISVRRPDGQVVLDRTLVLTARYRLTSYGVAVYRRRFIFKVAIPVSAEDLSPLSEEQLSELAYAILAWKHAQW